jgi:hypothetical protein
VYFALTERRRDGQTGSASIDVPHSGPTSPPTAPGLPVASDITEFSVTLTWPASTDDVGVAGYEVWRNYTDIFQLVATPTSTTVTVGGLNRGSVSRFYIAARDAAGNRSQTSPGLTVITLPGDLEPPGPVYLLTASEITGTSARLTWQGPLWGEADVFRVYRGQTAGTPVLVGTTSAVNPGVRTFVFTDLTPATQYFLGVSAVDAAGNQSGISQIPITTTGVAVPPTCTVSYRVSSQWNGAFNADVRITNTAPAAISGWTLRWTYASTQRITAMWNAGYTQTGASVEVTNLGYNAVIAANGGSQSFGFQGSWSTANANPASFTLNGQPCAAV